ncbi:uncharacterized protein LOC143911471 [Arctopsyche grandis]|uniref:uncharacterized protein LOC143911471 n=1 Tax=Arctopsyche grandis TaxID=121162 RepID=UPI00406D9B35
MAKTPSLREFLVEFIQLYRNFPALWQVGSKDYTDRKKKAEAYEILISKFKEIEPNANRETVKRKINSMRSNYRKELRKIRMLQKAEDDTPRYFEPTLWYFDELAFLGQHEVSDDGIITLPGCEVDVLAMDDNSLGDDISKTMSTPTSTPKLDRKRPREDPQKEVLFISCEQQGKDDTEYDLYARMWAMELKKMKPDQQIYAKKAIYDILLEGQLETLQKDSVQINSKIDNQQCTPLVYKFTNS